MERKLPPEAFDFYVSLGLKRSYQAVAEKYGVSKVAVVNLAKRERWQARIAEVDAKAREASERQMLKCREESIEQFRKTWEVVLRRSLEALRSHPISSAIDAVRSLNLATKNLLLLNGEPTERVDNIETIIRREYERWTKREGEEDWDDVADLPQPGHASSDDPRAGRAEGASDGAAA